MMVGFILKELKGPLLQCELYHDVKIVRYGITSSHYLFAVLEKYNPYTCTFVTLEGEMRFALREIFEISGLSIGDLPYEGYIPVLKNCAY